MSCQSMIVNSDMMEIEYYCELYPKGNKLELLSDLNELYTPKFADNVFTLKMIDDAGNTHGS